MPDTTQESIAAVQDRWRAALVAGEDQAAAAMAAHWREVEARTSKALDDLLAKVDAARQAGRPLSPAWLYQEQRARALLEQAQQQAALFARTAHQQITTAQAAAQARGAQAAIESVDAALSSSFTTPNTPDTLGIQAGYLADGSPLADLLGTMPQQTGEALRQALTQGIAAGWGIDRMRREAMTSLGITRNRAETILRTEVMRTYREAHRQTYLANSDVLQGWTWWATLGSSRTCAGCIAMHGTVHKVDETLDGHPRCRCAMVPLTEGTKPPQTGLDWLRQQPDPVIRHHLGTLKFKAWKDGRIRLSDLVARTSDPRWGTMRRERSLKEILEGRNADFGTPARRAVPANGEAMPVARPTPQQGPGYVYDGRAEWERWREGRDVRVSARAGRAERERLTRARDHHATNVAEDQAMVARARERLKAEQARLRSYVPDAKARAAAARKDSLILNAKQSLADAERYLERSTAELARAEQALADAMGTPPPAFDAANPLKGYGDRLVISDETAQTGKHLADLEQHVPLHHHQAVRDHYAGMPKGGLYVGDEMLPDLDDLGYLRHLKDGPRGHQADAAWDGVGGVYSPRERVTAIARKAWRRDDAMALHATAVHEMGHTVEDAYQALLGPGLRPSETQDWLRTMRGILDKAVTANPYYTPTGNAAGWASESWAESYAAWAMRRTAPHAERVNAVLRALGVANRGDDVLKAADEVLAYFDRLDADLAKRVG